MTLLAGKRVLITGGSTGIGAAAAVEAARQGADVAINYASSEARAQQVIAQIEALGRKGLAVQGDVADPATATDFVSKAVEALGGVDVFVTNAGSALSTPSSTCRSRWWTAHFRSICMAPITWFRLPRTRW
jgi:L-rhamnose 1-dehydrogenase